MICQKVGVDPGDRLSNNTKKRKWLVKLPFPPDSAFPSFQDFEVVHHYLQMKSKEFQARVRKRGQKGKIWITQSKYNHVHYCTYVMLRVINIRIDLQVNTLIRTPLENPRNTVR